MGVVECNECMGLGIVPGIDPDGHGFTCSKCRGSGTVPEPDSLAKYVSGLQLDDEDDA